MKNKTDNNRQTKKEEEQNLATDRELLFVMAMVKRQIKIK